MKRVEEEKVKREEMIKAAKRIDGGVEGANNDKVAGRVEELKKGRVE